MSGIYADRLGREPLFIVNILIYSVGALIAAFAPNYEVLLLVRVIVGIGLGGEMALGYTLVAEFIPRRQRAASSATMSLMHGGVGIWAASLLAAVILGPVAAVLGHPEYAWRILLGVMVFPAILALIARRSMPETPRFLLRAHRIDELNLTLTASCRNAFAWVRETTSPSSWSQGPGRKTTPPRRGYGTCFIRSCSVRTSLRRFSPRRSSPELHR